MNRSGRFVGGNFAYVSEAKADSLARNLALPGDIVFTQRGTLGQVSLVPDSHDRFVVSQSQMRLRVNNRALPAFVFHAFSAPTMTSQVKGLNTATANPHINLGIMSKIEVPLPPVERQRQIVEVLDASWTGYEVILTELANFRAFRSTLLTSLLSQDTEIPESYDDILERTA